MSDDRTPDAGTVVSLTQLEATATQFPILNAVETYWNKMRGARAMPARSEIDPRGLDRALSRCFILERLAPGVARFRLAGTHLNDILGMEVRGMPLTALFLTDARKDVSTSMEQVFQAPATARFRLAGDRGIGKPPLDAAMLLLPLMSDLGEVTRILGCLPTMGPIGRTPRRFDVRQNRVLPIHVAGTPQADEGAWPSGTDRRADASVTGLSEPRAPFASVPGAPRPQRTDKPNLYLVASNDSPAETGSE